MNDYSYKLMIKFLGIS